MPMKTKELQREYQRVWMMRRRQSFFHDKSCQSCGAITNLELHHIDRSTKTDHKIWSWKKERREKELEKCIVLCRNCHHELHTIEQTAPLVHGTGNAYWNKGCRCDECKKFRRDSMREYRQRISINV